MPGRSLTRPPRTSTTECSCRLCPSPGMYAVTSMPPEMRTRATLRSAEFGFLGVVVYTRVHTPRRCGAATFFLRPLPDFRPGVASFLVFGWRPLRISCEVVGMRPSILAVAGPSALHAGGLVRGPHGLGLRRSTLPQIDRQGGERAHREELRLPVLQRPVPEVRGAQVLPQRQRRLVMVELVAVVLDAPGHGLRDPRAQPDRGHEQQQRVRVD